MKKVIYITIILLSAFGTISCQKDANVNQEKIQELINLSNNTYTDGILISHKGNVIKKWRNSKCETKLYNTASMVKSWTALVIGILIDDGYIKDEDELVCKYLPNWEDGCKYDVTIKNLLQMSSGLNRRPGASGILPMHDMYDYAINVKLDTTPNVRFGYSNSSVQLLGLVIEEVTGKNANEYFTEKLFNPLQMKETHLGKDDAGNYATFGGARTTLEDAVKIGELVLNKGLYKGTRIISEEWIDKCVQPSDNADYYGYLFWVDYQGEYVTYAAMGDFGQLTVIYPELDLVLIRQQSCNKDISGNMKWMGPSYLNLIGSIIDKK